jgi:hypothetical protein
MSSSFSRGISLATSSIIVRTSPDLIEKTTMTRVPPIGTSSRRSSVPLERRGEVMTQSCREIFPMSLEDSRRSSSSASREFSASRIAFCSVAESASMPDKAVKVEPVADVCRHPPGGCVRMVDVAEVFEIGHDVSDGRRTQPENVFVTPGDVTGPYRRRGFYEIPHDVVEDRPLPFIEFPCHASTRAE